MCLCKKEVEGDCRCLFIKIVFDCNVRFVGGSDVLSV